MTLTTNLAWQDDRDVLALFARALVDAGLISGHRDVLYLLSTPWRWTDEFAAWDEAGRPQKVIAGRHAEDWHAFLDALDELGADQGRDVYLRRRHAAYWMGEEDECSCLAVPCVCEDDSQF